MYFSGYIVYIVSEKHMEITYDFCCAMCCPSLAIKIWLFEKHQSQLHLVQITLFSTHSQLTQERKQSTTMASGRTLKLNSGYTMPVVGLGTWVCWKSGSNYSEIEWWANVYSNPRKTKSNTLLLRLWSADIVISMLPLCTAMKPRLEKESRHLEFLVKISL